MNDNKDKSNNRAGMIFAFIFIWIVICVIGLFSGHLGGYFAGMRPGGWNIHMIYPPIYGGIIGLISYPILALSLEAMSPNKYIGLFFGAFVSVILSFALTFLIIRSSL